MTFWSFGQTVVTRNIARSDGGVTTAIPMITICDDSDCLALYLPVGTRWLDNYNVAPEHRAEMVGRLPPARERPHRERVWSLPVIKLYLPETPFSAWLFFQQDWRFTTWYGNLEAHYQRTPIGIDCQDHALDVVVDQQLQWRLKDEEEFKRRLDLGIDTAAHHAGVRAAAVQFIDRLTRRAPPFDRDWTEWRPPQAWSPRDLPPDWSSDFGTTFQSL